MHNETLDSPSNQHKHVLVVEDNPGFMRSLTEALNTLGMGKMVVLCTTGAEALQRLRTAGQRFDLILVDIGLPDISGLEVVHHAHQQYPQALILVVSVLSAQGDLLAAIRAGASGYINKSDTTIAVADAIQNLLDGNFPISPSLARALFKLAGHPARSPKDTEQYDLTPRELETLKYISKGLSYQETAEMMDVKITTVQTNIRRIYAKLNVNNQTVAITKARNAGLL
jgi:two-component system, NarL family, nitrate/nitrite response regulator NarL